MKVFIASPCLNYICSTNYTYSLIYPNPILINPLPNQRHPEERMDYLPQNPLLMYPLLVWISHYSYTHTNVHI